MSWRRRGPFVALNCAALVETLLEPELFGIEDRTATGVKGRRGKFERADGGTLFLDEVSDLSLSAQAKLLRATQGVNINDSQQPLSKRKGKRKAHSGQHTANSGYCRSDCTGSSPSTRRAGR